MTEYAYIEKTYPIVLEDSTSSTLRVRLDYPQPDGDDWVTLITIESPERVVVRRAYQVDSFGSLLYGLWMLRMFLEIEKDRYGLWDIPDFWPRGVFENMEDLVQVVENWENGCI